LIRLRPFWFAGDGGSASEAIGKLAGDDGEVVAAQNDPPRPGDSH
jgi:hypothetical protein